MTDFTKPVQTRSGLPVTIITTEGRDPYPIVGYVDDEYVVSYWKADGTYYENVDRELINVPEKRVMYVNVYNELIPFAYTTREHADQDKYIKARIACIRVEYTEGQFDE